MTVELKEISVIDWGNTSLTKKSYQNQGEFLGVSAAGCDGRIGHAEHNVGTLVLSAIGAKCGKMFFPEEPFTAIKNTITITPNELVDGKFLYYYLNNYQISSRGAGQPFITKTDASKKIIPLPPLDQQKQIAKILDTADDYRKKTKALIEKYDQLTQSLFLEMFGDPVTNPKGWEKVNLNSLCDFQKISVKPEGINKGQTYIGLESIEKESGVILEKFIVEKGEIKSNKFWFDEHYILYGKLRPYLNKVANPNFEGICSTDIIPIRPILLKTNKEFIVSLMRGKWFVAFAHERSSGANLPRISPKEVEKYQAISPPIQIQNQFSERVQAIELQKLLAQQELEKAESLFSCLLQRAFKGELTN